MQNMERCFLIFCETDGRFERQIRGITTVNGDKNAFVHGGASSLVWLGEINTLSVRPAKSFTRATAILLRTWRGGQRKLDASEAVEWRATERRRLVFVE